jgi:NitT/TauT family transport system permease protein
MSSQAIELQARPGEVAGARTLQAEPVAPPAASTATPKPAPRALLLHPIVRALYVPVAAAVALAVHRWVPDAEPTPLTSFYAKLLMVVGALGAVAVVLQLVWPGCRQWIASRAPLIAAATLAVCAWDCVTLKFELLPLPYFPSPELILSALVADRAPLFEATWRSLLLLSQGYLLGVIAGLIFGVSIGWSLPVRYWGMPILKVVGPIPATAWIPLAIVVLPGNWSAVALIALAVWFPVTMLTSSGVANTRASYLDVARTLGASRWYLVFRVAIPAAMPSIFIGLFMGLGSSFLTLAAAESVGVKTGLGWYVSWARDWAEYGKVYAALLVMAAFFSTIMTVLFKLRDRVLVWQKGVIKW